MLERLPSPRRLFPPAVLWLALFGLAATAILPLERMHLIRCAVLAFTGRPCPGCGMTRALAAVLRLDLSRAIALNPFALVLFPLLVLLGLAALLPPLRRRFHAALSRCDGAARVVFWGVVAAYLAFGLLRFCGVFRFAG